jgi:CRISPR-associated endonuclease/helicase Cas3
MTCEPFVNTHAPNSGLLLIGLDGSNPLGFLAALGLLRVLISAFGPRQLRMKWSPSVGTWVPAIHSSSHPSLDQDALLDVLCERLPNHIENHPVRLLDELDSSKANMDARRRIFTDRIEQSAGADRTQTDWLAALASDIAPPDATNQLQTARRDYYFGNLKSVIQHSKRAHLRRSLFHLWDYADPLDNQSLHLDPSEDRRHAHQWNKPAGDPDRRSSGGMLGANRLALEAIPLFTSLPEGGKLRTVGFTGSSSANTRWTWPIWRVFLDMESIASLLKLGELQAEVFNRQQRLDLRERGIVAAYRTRRILVQKTPNFTPVNRVA